MASNNQVVSIKALLEAGVHFGHRTRRWNPKMKPFIFTERNGIHIIDLQQTIGRLNQAFELVRDTVASGGIILFVGTKKQAQESLIQEARRCNMPYVDQRWLGGTLTNWRTIRQRIDYLLEIEKQQMRGEFARLPKKEALMREKEITRLNHRLGGLKEMRRLPNLLFVVDIRRDSIAIKEANILGIPIIALVDTNCDPDPIDYVIPSNDDAIRALKLMNATIADAVLEGRAILSTLRAEEEEAEGLEEEEAMERYLGPSTLAKIQSVAGKSAEGDEDEDYEEDEDYQDEEDVEEDEDVTEPPVTDVSEEPYVSGPPEPAAAETSVELESAKDEDVTEPPVTDVSEEPHVSQQSEAVDAAPDDEEEEAEEEPVAEAAEEPVGEKNNA